MDIENSSGEKSSKKVLEDDIELAARQKKEKLVKNRMEELQELQIALAKRGQRFSRYSALIKASVIILGALVATKETVSVVVGTSNTISIVGYTLAGVLIAVLTGLEAAFGWGAKSGKLAALAVTSRDIRQRADLDRIQISSQKNADANLALEKLLDRLMTELREVRNAAVESGLNPVIDAPSKWGEPLPPDQH